MKLAGRPSAVQRSVVLAVLREAGTGGVPYSALRELLGENPEEVLMDLRSRGHDVTRRPGHRGIVCAHLREPGLFDKLADDGPAAA